jgi:hypothetical protein
VFDELVYKLFSENWCGPQQADLELAKETLYKGPNNSNKVIGRDGHCIILWFKVDS